LALPHRRQQLAKFIPFHELTYAQVAAALGTGIASVHSLAHGRRYPTPDEIRKLEALFGLPVEVLFDPAMLTYRDVAQWPPVGAGFRGGVR
jgi:transcriptional regulator with XRE-family HTH domain